MSAPEPSQQSNGGYSPPPPPPTESTLTPSPTPSPTDEYWRRTPNGSYYGRILFNVVIVMGVLIVTVAVGFCVTRRRKKRRRGDNKGSDGLTQGAEGKARPVMNWPTRMKIALGSAKGLAYLHEDCHPKIIHRDIKAANILLDDNFDAKVADFGLAKFSADTDTHISTRVMGTFGYLAPDYAASGKLTIKSDVFSFGVVLLELITGRQPHDKTQSFHGDSMVEWARPLLMRALENGNFDALVDPRLHNGYNSSEMSRMATCAAACVSHSARQRPRMSVIVRVLEGNLSLDDLNEGIKPEHSRAFGSDQGRSQYNQADMNKFWKMALESQEQSTSESSGPA